MVCIKLDTVVPSAGVEKEFDNIPDSVLEMKVITVVKSVTEVDPNANSEINVGPRYVVPPVDDEVSTEFVNDFVIDIGVVVKLAVCACCVVMFERVLDTDVKLDSKVGEVVCKSVSTTDVEA